MVEDSKTARSFQFDINTPHIAVRNDLKIHSTNFNSLLEAKVTTGQTVNMLHLLWM